MKIEKLLKRQRKLAEKVWPTQTYKGVLDHIKQEIEEIERTPEDLEEWIDLILLSFAGAYRVGATIEEVINMLKYKQKRNEKRKWLDWREADPDKAINHVEE